MAIRKPYPSPGCCIYCLEPAPKLTDEHIVPTAFNGDWYIDDAACDTCRERTNTGYEGKAINCDMLRVPRRILNLRRKNRGKKSGPLRLAPTWAGDVASRPKVSDLPKIQLDEDDYPAIFALPVIEPPERLHDTNAKGHPTRNKFRLWKRSLDGERPGPMAVSDEIEFAYDTGKDTILSVGISKGELKVNVRLRFAMREFSMMLAKIAYCYAVAEDGLDGFDGSEIRQLLAGERDDIYNFVGGSSTGERLTRRYLHHLAVRKRGDLRTVIVQLFASYDAPSYEVVIGTA